MSIEDIELGPLGGDVEAATRAGSPDDYLRQLRAQAEQDARNREFLTAYAIAGLVAGAVGFALGTLFGVWVGQ